MNVAKNLLLMLNKQPQMHLILPQKKQFKRQQKQLVMSMVIKLLINLQTHHRILQRQLKIKQKYIKKDIYLQKKGKINDDLRLI